MVNIPTIETERLLLRPFTIEDAEGMFELDSDPEVVKYVGTPPVTTIDQSRAVIAFIQQQYTDNGVGRLAVILKENNAFLGWAGLKLIKKPTNGLTNFYETGYRFMPRYWGKGYATEATRAAVQLAFDYYKTEKLYAMAMKENTASRHVLEKCGFTHAGDFEEEGLLLDWFENTLKR